MDNVNGTESAAWPPPPAGVESTSPLAAAKPTWRELRGALFAATAATFAILTAFTAVAAFSPWSSGSVILSALALGLFAAGLTTGWMYRNLNIGFAGHIGLTYIALIGVILVSALCLALLELAVYVYMHIPSGTSIGFTTTTAPTVYVLPRWTPIVHILAPAVGSLVGYVLFNRHRRHQRGPA